MMAREGVKCDCDADVIGIEYGGLDPQHYDGISEWQCSKCGRRWGRWSGKEINEENPYEARYGIEDRDKKK